MSGPGVTNKIVISADGRTALTGGTDRVVRLWRLPVPERVRGTPDPSGPVKRPELFPRRRGRRTRPVRHDATPASGIDVPPVSHVAGCANL